MSTQAANTETASSPTGVASLFDPFIMRVIVVMLGLVVLIVVAGGMVLAFITTKDIPQGVLAIGSSAAGGLVGLLAPSPVSKNSTTSTSVDPWIFRVIVAVLGVVVLAVVIGGMVLALVTTKDIPQGVLAIGSSAAGGLVGLLVPLPIGQSSAATK